MYPSQVKACVNPIKSMASNLKLYNEDCMPALEKMADNQFDLAIVDPPYGIGDFCMVTGDGGSKWRKKWDQSWNNKTPGSKYFEEIKRVSKNNIIFGANYYNCFDNLGGAIVWFKDVKHPNMSKCEIASCSFHKKVEYVSIVWQNVNRNELMIHPCQKPVKLYKWLLKNYAKEWDTILDTHLGSGSIAIACYDMGFDLTGYEIDKDYFKAMQKRIKDHTSQLSML